MEELKLKVVPYNIYRFQELFPDLRVVPFQVFPYYYYPIINRKVTMRSKIYLRTMRNL